MPFEKFDDARRGRGRPKVADPVVSLRKSGSIGINQPAIENHFDDEEAVVVYYDEENSRIGIEPVADKATDKAAYSLSGSGTGATIAARAFLETHDLVPDITTHYDPEWEDEHGFVVVDLEEPIDTYGSSSEKE